MASKNLPEETREGEAVQREKWERPRLNRLEANLATASKGKNKDGAAKGPNSFIS